MGNVADLLPTGRTLEEARSAAVCCRRCPLWLGATRLVYGEGAAGARVMLVGDAPEPEDDQLGRPFTGRAGRLVDLALAEVGLDRDEVYLTNVLKHLRPASFGRRRTGDEGEGELVAACRAWLDEEIAEVAPEVVVCLGAMAARVVLGADAPRGTFLATPQVPAVLVTAHPSVVLRAPGPEARRQAWLAFVSDLATVAERVRGGE